MTDMAIGTERSKALHNFTLPEGLRWGNQRFLRCMKVNSNGQISPLNPNTSDHRHRYPIQQRNQDGQRDKNSSPEFVHGSLKVTPTPPPVSDDTVKFSNNEEDGICAMREKVMPDLQSAADKMKDAMFKEGLDERNISVFAPALPPAATSGDGEVRPWNLRTRRAASKTSVSGIVSDRNDGPTTAGGGKGFEADLAVPDSGLSQICAVAAILKSPTHKADGSSTSGKERTNFSLSLSKREIEEDFLGMVGHRPPRRPKKRAKIVQKELDTLFPGLFLTEVNSDMYKVPEAAAP